MKNIEEITQLEWNQMLTHKAKAFYNQQEAIELVNLVRMFINPRQGNCFSCGNTLRQAKTTLAEWVLVNKDKVEEILKNKELAEQPIEKTTEITTETNKKAKKDGKKGK